MGNADVMQWLQSATQNCAARKSGMRVLIQL
jgi:hypothetical protein